MTRYFCDRCGKEMPKDEHGRLSGSKLEERFGFEVITQMNGTGNAGLLCHDCVRALVALTAPATGGVVDPGQTSMVREMGPGCGVVWNGPTQAVGNIRISDPAPVDVANTVAQLIRWEMQRASPPL